MLAIIFEGVNVRLPFSQKQIIKSFCSAEEEYYLVNMGCTKTLFCRIGDTKVNATARLTRLKTEFNVDNIILTGSAFAFDDTLALDAVAVGSGTFAYDVDFSQTQTQRFAKPDVSKWFFTPSPLITSLAWRAANQCGVNAVTGTFASGDRYLPSSQLSTELVADGVSFIDSNSATIGEFADANGIPFGIVKGLAGYVNGTSGEDYAAARVAANALSLAVAAKMVSVTCHDPSPCPYFVPLSADQAEKFAFRKHRGTLFAEIDSQRVAANVFYRAFRMDSQVFAIIANPDDRTAFYLDSSQDVVLVTADETKNLKSGTMTTSVTLVGQAYTVNGLNTTSLPVPTQISKQCPDLSTNGADAAPPCVDFVTVLAVSGIDGKILFTPRATCD